MADKVLKKVIFEYDDGSSKSIEGNPLEKWMGYNRQVVLFCNIHGQNPDWQSVQWTQFEKEQEVKEEEIADNPDIKDATS